MIIVFDIGGSKMRFARSDTLSDLGDPIIVDTPSMYEEAIAEAAQVILTLAKGEPIAAVVGGVAGTLDERHGTLHASPNMRAWIGKSLVSDLKRLTGAAQVVIKNDADLAALGEATVGAGKGYEHVAYMTISTGVGGGFVSKGELLNGRYGVEPGHQIINDKTGETLEQVIGGRHLELQYHKKPRELEPAMYEMLTKRLAIGVHNMIQLWSPDVVVLGGAQMRDISIDLLTKEVARLNVMFPYVPDILVAELGDLNGLYGAVSYAQKHVRV